MFYSYRNQSMAVHCKSVIWFLFDCNIDIEKNATFENTWAYLAFPCKIFEVWTIPYWAENKDKSTSWSEG